MHRIATPTAETDKWGPGKPGFTDGDASTGTPTTRLEDDWCDAVQEELANVVELAGDTLNTKEQDADVDTGHRQLWLAGGLHAAYGDGSGGDHTTAGNETLTGDVYYDRFTISAGHVVNADGFRVFCHTLLIEAGAVLHNDGEDGADIAPGSAGGAGTVRGGWDGGIGGAPGDGNAANGDTDASTFALGGGGGDGGDAGGTGGTGTVLTAPPASAGIMRHLSNGFGHLSAPLLSDNNPIVAPYGGGGGGGGGGDVGHGGGGGGGGGLLVVAARKLNNQGTIRANGGDGGNGNSGGAGGGGGGGGVVILITRTPAAFLGDIEADGGAGGEGAGASPDGQDGAVGQLIVVTA